MSVPNIARHVITGGPGFGKTTLIKALEQQGYKSMPESSRFLIQEIVARGGSELPWLDRAAFQDLIVPRRIDDYLGIREDGTYFFDRGLPDEIAYYCKDGLEPPPACMEACSRYRYDQVFVVPPWEEIHVNDAERKESFEEAVRIHHEIERAYEELGYGVIEVPRDTVENRVSFILAHLQRPGPVV